MANRLLDGDRSIPAGRVCGDRALLLADSARPAVAPTKWRSYMRVGIATDQGGFHLKEDLLSRLKAAGHEVVDFGPYSLTPGDNYPYFVIPLARAVAVGEVERGVAFCGSGVGAAVAANKMPGVRAGLIGDHDCAHQGVEQDHINVLCLGGRTLGPEVAWEFVETYLAAEFSRAERHLRRLSKMAGLEEVIR
jgi:ribose 5-phosphate isomerase B